MANRDSRSFRARLRAFQAMRGDAPDPAFVADLEFLENRDLDLSVRLGAMLAFNALMTTIGTHPISASPGAPLSLNAATQPLEVAASILAIVPLLVSSFLCLKAMLLGENFDVDGEETELMLRQRLFAAFIRSIDTQQRRFRHAILCSYCGVIATVLIWVWIIADKVT